MPFQIACQTITFGPEQYERFPEVFAAVREVGYTGVEVGYRHLANHSAGDIKQMLSDAGLTLVASHLGGNLEDTGQAEGERSMIDEVLDYLNALGTTHLAYSGPQFESEEQYGRMLDALNATAEKCRERGVHLLYHNHWWEFLNDWRAMNMILERGCEALGFCPDVGWVHKGGAEVVEFLDKVKGRLGTFHYKDFATRDVDEKDFCTLGEGVTPLGDITAWLRANAPDLWVIAEQGRSDLQPQEAVARNAAFLEASLP